MRLRSRSTGMSLAVSHTPRNSVRWTGGGWALLGWAKPGWGPAQTPTKLSCPASASNPASNGGGMGQKGRRWRTIVQA